MNVYLLAILLPVEFKDANLQLFWHTSTCTDGCKTFDKAEESSPNAPASAISRGCYQWHHAITWSLKQNERRGGWRNFSNFLRSCTRPRQEDHGREASARERWILLQRKMLPLWLCLCTLLPWWEVLLHLGLAVYTPLHRACSTGYTYSREEELVDSLALRQEGLRDMQGTWL